MLRNCLLLLALTPQFGWGRTLWFDAPAEEFIEACPLGNGRLGAMVFGGVEHERLLLNETGMWSGSPQEADRPQAREALPEIRRLLLAGKNFEAEQLVNKTFTCAGVGSGRGRGKSVPFGSYQMLANLRLDFEHPAGEVRDYRRELDLETAIARVTYRVGEVEFVREAFVSAPGEAVVVRLSASEPGRLSLDVGLDRPERATIVAGHDETLELSGQLEDGRQGEAGVRFATVVHARPQGGSVKRAGETLEIRAADEVLLVVTAATQIHTFAGRRVEEASATAREDLRRISLNSCDELRQAHLQDFTPLMQRVKLVLPPGDAKQVADSTPARIAAYGETPDDDLAATLFDYGRYLLICSSRPGGLPANLQGLWADGVQTPWNGDWHLDVNVQMNYWHAETTNLSVCHEPLFALINSLVAPGGTTARSYYGARGWVAHVFTNPWGFTAPGESASWGSSTSSAWLCQHVWDHYLFTRDKQFLAACYSTLKGCAEFYLDMLIEEPTHGWLVTAPSNSPENAFLDGEGRQIHTCLGPTIDQQMIRYLFVACREAAQILERDPEFQSQLSSALKRLAPTQISREGRIMEWLAEAPEADPHHRHISHMWGVYPGNEISPQRTAKLAAAARKSLDVRGDDSTGWSMAYKACTWARLGDGNRTLRVLGNILRPVGRGDDNIAFRGGAYPNLFDAHPPFQIDGNFGATAAIAELLLQSEWLSPSSDKPAELWLLPALPERWPAGSVTGLCARGGVEVELAWNAGKLASATLRSRVAQTVRLHCGEQQVLLPLAAGEVVRLGGELRREESHR